MGQNRILNILRLGLVQELDGIQISPIQLDNANSLGSVGEEIISDYPAAVSGDTRSKPVDRNCFCLYLHNQFTQPQFPYFYTLASASAGLQLAAEQRDSKQSC